MIRPQRRAASSRVDTGYLRHVRCRGGEGDQVGWVTLTFWSRTTRDNAWWGAFLAAENDRGVSADYLPQALSSELPAQVDSPVDFVRRRLWDKLPPVLPDTPAASADPVRHLMMECTECGTPGRPEALPDGLCRPCRAPGRDVAPDHAAAHTAPAVVRDISVQVGQLRDLFKAP